MHIFTKESFSTLIEETKYRLRMNYLDCIIYICEKEKIDLDDVPKLLTKNIKKNIENEMIELKMVKYESKRCV